jgi:hypothetical protein
MVFNVVGSQSVLYGLLMIATRCFSLQVYYYYHGIIAGTWFCLLVCELAKTISISLINGCSASF